MNRRSMLTGMLVVALACGASQAAAWMELARPPEQIIYDGQPAWEYWYDMYAGGTGPPTQVWIDFDATQMLNLVGTTHYERWDSAAAGYGFSSGPSDYPSYGYKFGDWILPGYSWEMINPIHMPIDYKDVPYGRMYPGSTTTERLHYWWAYSSGYSAGLFMTIRVVHPNPPGNITYGIYGPFYWEQNWTPIIGPAPLSPGDLDQDGDIDADDIDLMGDYIRTGIAPTTANYDLSDDGATGGTDGSVTILDLDYLVRFLVETSAVDGDGNPIFGTQYGDFNLDGEIELGDLTRLGTYYGVGDTWAEGNANPHLDEDIELGDLTILGTYYGASNGGVDAIPEPMTLSLLAVGAAALLGRRKSGPRRDGRA